MVAGVRCAHPEGPRRLMSNGKYRYRTLLRERLPEPLAALLRKGRRDCGEHEWYKAGEQPGTATTASRASPTRCRGTSVRSGLASLKPERSRCHTLGRRAGVTVTGD